MPLADVLAHVATPWRTSVGAWVEGEFVPGAPVAGVPFDCVLFLPAPGAEDLSGGAIVLGRRIIQPTLMYEPFRADGSAVALSAEDEVDVVAPEVNAAEGRASGAAVRWQVVGAPQPLGRPGDDAVAVQATLRRVAE